jgi:peptidoglycan/xylan/chitin deacetylase (PgdA/CDA1 family)
MRSAAVETVPILMYHRVVDSGELGHAYDTTAEKFERDLDYLRESGIRSASFAEYLEALRTGKWPTAERRVILTFDDALVSYHRIALPLLERYSQRATFFIPTGFLERDPGQLSVAQLREMHEAGMEIQSHSHSHPFLSQLKPEELRDELVRSRDLLEKHLAAPVRVVACPGGRYNRKVIRMAHEVGYLGVCTSRPGYAVRSNVQGIHVFDRLVVHARTPRAEFEGLLDKRLSLVRKKRWGYNLRASVRSILGHRLYHMLWSSVSRWRAMMVGRGS